MDNYGRNRKWSTASGLAFWGSAIQTSFNLIGLTLVLYVGYNLVDILMSGFLPSMASMSLDYYEDRFAGFVGGATICFVIAFLGYLLYMVGIYLFTGAQSSENSKIKTRNIMLAELIGPALIILFYVGYYASPEILGLILEHYIATLIAVSALSLAAVIIPMVEFKTLSKEETWSEGAQKGADDLKFSYSCILWNIVVIILALGMAALVVYSSYTKLKYGNFAGTDKYGYPIQGITSIAQEFQNLVAAIKVIFFIASVLVFIFALLQTIYRILGWNKIKNGTPVAGVAEEETQEEAVVVEPETEPQTELQSADITADYEDEESDSKKKWMMWGGIAAGFLVVAAAIWALWGRGERFEPNAKIYADRSVVFNSVEDGIGTEAMEELTFGTPVESVAQVRDSDGKWVKVAYESDGKTVKGYMAKDDILDTEDFDALYVAGLSDGQARFHLPFKIQRLAVLDAVKSNGSAWHLEGIKLYGERQPNAKRLSVRGTSPSGECLGFIMRNSETDERKFFLYSIPDSYNMDHTGSPVFLYSETPRSGEDIVYDAYYKEKGNRYEVIYQTMTKDEGSDSSLFEVLEVPAEEEVTEYADEKQYAGEIELNGHVDGKYPVRMVLTMHEGGAVSGTVTYLKYNVPMELTGSFTDSGDWRDLSLEERSEGKTTGNFIGRYDGKIFSGSWVSADGAKEMPFKVER